MTRIGTPPFGRWRRDVRRSRRTCAPDRRHGPLRAQWHARSAATSRRGTARRRKTARRAPSRPRRALPRCSTTDRRAPRPRASGPRGPRSRHARPRLRVDRELAAAIEARRRRATRSRTPSRARARTLARWENPACAPAANPPGRGPPRPRRDGARARVGFTSRRDRRFPYRTVHPRSMFIMLAARACSDAGRGDADSSPSTISPTRLSGRRRRSS